MNSPSPTGHTNRLVQKLRHSVDRLWHDESATPSGRSVKLATAVITLLGATGVAAQFVR